MKKRLLILLSILALSCSSEDGGNITDKTSLTLVTGINFRQTDDPDEIPLKLGNPNIFNNNKFIIFSNPIETIINISATENITDVWLVKSVPEKIHQEENFTVVLSTTLYSEQQIVANSIRFTNGLSSNYINMDIGALQKGYYKVFVKINGMIYWDNIYKYQSQESSNDEFEAINTFWKN